MILREILHAHAPWLERDATVRDAVDKMDVYRYSGLVIVDEERRPLGILTEGDVCRAALTRGSVVAVGGDPALEWASREPRCAPGEMEISDALHLMLGSGLTVLPIVAEGMFEGVVGRVDLMQAMLMDAATRAEEGC